MSVAKHLLLGGCCPRGLPIHHQKSPSSHQVLVIRIRVRFMVFIATFNNISAISWRSDLLVKETGVPGENNRPLASH